MATLLRKPSRVEDTQRAEVLRRRAARPNAELPGIAELQGYATMPYRSGSRSDWTKVKVLELARAQPRTMASVRSTTDTLFLGSGTGGRASPTLLTRRRSRTRT